MSPFPPIEDLVPHSPPTLAIDQLVSWTPGRATFRLEVTEATLLVSNGVVQTIVALEFMAQAVAGCLGYEAFRSGGGVRVGMVVACRRMTIARPTITVGERLAVHVTCVRSNDYVSAYDAEVRDEADAVVCTATMTILHGDKPPN